MMPAPVRDPRRAALAHVQMYRPDRAACDVNLSDNTNRWGMSPAAEHAIADAARLATSYPDAYTTELKSAIAEYLGVPANHVVTGCGSDDVLDAAIRALSDPGSSIAIAGPTFPMIAKFAMLNGLEVVEVPLTGAYDVDPTMLLWCGPRLAYICSPNNPTGTRPRRETIAAVAERIDGVLIVDEAYAEFAGESVIDLATSVPNVLVTRTMSKAFGLAGLRVGYAIGSPDIVTAVETSRGPYKVNAIGAAAAVAALREGLPWMREHVALAIDVRERLATELRAREIDAIPSSANFLCAPLPGAMQIAAAMHAHGVSVRAYAGLPTLSPALEATNGEALRISVGPWHEVRQALAALDKVRR